MSLFSAESECSCDFNKQGRNTKHVRMFQAMPAHCKKNPDENPDPAGLPRTTRLDPDFCPHG